MDFSTGERNTYPFPELVVSSELRLLGMKINPDGSLLARFTDKDKPEYLYHFSNGEWQEAPILFTFKTENIYVFCEDAQGTVYVITTDFSREIKNWRLGFYGQTTSAWNWTERQLGESDRIKGYLRDIAMDNYGRIWVIGIYDNQTKSDRLMNFVSVFQKNGNQLQLLEEYTDNNSNIDYIQQITTTDGRVWLKGRSLYWVDTQTEELPSPLPVWAIWISDGLSGNFGWFWAILAGQLILFLIGLSLEYM